MAETVVLTGAGGFMGRPMLRALRESGFRVRAIFGSGDSTEPAAVGDIVCDISDRAALAPVVADADIVVHLAGPPSVARSFSEPARTIRDHAVGTAVLLEALGDTRLERFVYVSSAEVYGQPERNPVSEDEPARPLSPYGAAKLAAEIAVSGTAIARDHQAVILRPFTLYGPGLRPGSLIDRIVSRARADQPVSVMDLAPVRDYLWVGDAIEALIAACTTPQDDQVRAYNLGSGVGRSVADLVACAQRISGSTARVASSGRRDRPAALDVSRLVAATGRIERWLRWRPSTPLEIGLAELLGEPQSRAQRG